MNHESNIHRAVSSPRYLNLVLTAIAVLLTLHLFRQPLGLEPEANAQSRSMSSADQPAAGMPNAAEQRVREMHLIEEMSNRVQSIVTRLNKGGFEVKVTEMPEVKLKKE